MPIKKKTTPSTAMKVYSFRMREDEYEAANKQSKKKYKTPLSALHRELILREFPSAKSKGIL